MKRKQHKILDRPILGGLLLMLWGYLFYQLGTVIGSVAGTLGMVASSPAKFLSGEPITMESMGPAFTAAYYAGAVFGILGLIIHRLWFRTEFKGCFSKNFFRGRDVLICFAVAAAVIIGMDIAADVTNELEFTFTNLGIALMAGICEEMSIRVLPVSVMMRGWMDEKHVPAIAVITSVTFGLVHFTNMLSGASFVDTLVQVIMAIGIGIFFAAVYLRTANILPCILFHFTHDFLALLVKGSYNMGVITKLSAGDIIISLGVGVLCTAIGLFMLRKSVRQDIVNVWREQWSVTDEIPAADAEPVNA